MERKLRAQASAHRNRADIDKDEDDNSTIGEEPLERALRDCETEEEAAQRGEQRRADHRIGGRAKTGTQHTRLQQQLHRPVAVSSRWEPARLSSAILSHVATSALTSSP